MKKGLVFLTLLLFVFACTPVPRVFTFVNDTAATTIQVSPNPGSNQAWAAFTIAPAARQTLSLNEPYCYFSFDNEQLVYPIRYSNSEIHFVDNNAVP
jgi:hypothetical protein